MTDRPRLFGTDGVRGIAGEYPLDRETVARLGAALGTVLAREVSTRPLRVVLGEDTRESSASISRRLAAGLKSKGVEVVYAGVITTPGVAFLTRHHGFAAGVMVSASHNPYQDNGVKVLSATGVKLTESVELEIERALGDADGPDSKAAPLETESAIEPDPALRRDYVDHLVSLSPDGNRLSHVRLVFDCANGAACRVVPELARRLGIKAHIIHAEPDGRNINLGCGSLYPETMAEETKAQGADLGVAFDGDADRAIFSTREGRIADGDHVLFATAPYFKRSAALKGDAVVGTLMTNLGLELAFAKLGIGLKRTAVGDRYVLEEMLRSGINSSGRLSFTATLRMICGNCLSPRTSSPRDCPVSASTRSTWSSVMIPSPASEMSEKMTWPEGSPPRLIPERSISSSTYLSPTAVRFRPMPRSARASSRPRLLMSVPTTASPFSAARFLKQGAVAKST